MNEQLKAAQGIRDRAIKDKILLQERLDAGSLQFASIIPVLMLLMCLQKTLN
jgi:hypothetical protein